MNGAKVEVVAAVGVLPSGALHARGWRAHCDCGYLSNVTSNCWAHRWAAKHRREHAREPLMQIASAA